jgi:uncharacterized protein (AIM24 family)
MTQDLSGFDETADAGAFALQNKKLLKVRLDAVTIQAKSGSMVAYQGDVRFEHAGAGLNRVFKKALSGEGGRLMKVSGSGEVFLADQAQHVHLLELSDEAITCNSRNLLAFDAGIEWDINRVSGGFSGVLAGGLFNTTLRGSGWVALLSDGEPVRLDVAEAPTFGDPAAAVAWSSGVTTEVKTDVQLKSFIGFGSGESLQLGFSGTGWVLVQPSEGPAMPAA